MAEYIKNSELREKVTEYNLLNIEDDGSWIPEYLQRMRRKHQLQQISDEKFELAEKFAQQRLIDTKLKFENYNKLSPEDKYKYRVHLKELRDELWLAFKRIVDGRIASMGLYKTLKDPDNIADISTDAVLYVFKYINRYDSSRSSSAFAYITQTAWSNIVSSLNTINDREQHYITGIDFLDNVKPVALLKQEDIP